MRIGPDFPSYKGDEMHKQNETGSDIPELDEERLGSERPINLYRSTPPDQDCESRVDDDQTEIEACAGTRSLSSARNGAEQNKEDFFVGHTIQPDGLALHGRVGGDGGVIEDMNFDSEQQMLEKDECYKNNDDVGLRKSTFSGKTMDQTQIITRYNDFARLNSGFSYQYMNGLKDGTIMLTIKGKWIE